MVSTHERVSTELWKIHHQLHNEVVARSLDRGTIVDFKFLSKFLSPVRDQGSIGACAFVSAVACTEMVYRIGGRSINGIRGRYACFDVQDCFEHAYKNPELAGLPGLEMKLADTMGLEGTNVLVVLRYMVTSGLLSNCVCANPQEKNPALVYAPSPNRNILPFYRRVKIDEVISLLETSPIIGVMKGYGSFMDCKRVFFHGSTTTDRWNFEREKVFHALCLVGKFRLASDEGERQFVIIQNSHGIEYGFKGYVCAELTGALFVEFWMPMLDIPT